jgi:hypothetical protein
MTAAYEELISLLDEREVGYQCSDEDQSIATTFRGDVGNFRVFAQVDSDIQLFQVFGYSPIRIPEGARPAIAQAVARANYGLRVGKFELDLDDGEIRFQTSHILHDDAVGQDVIDRLIGNTMSMLDLYLPAFLSVVYGNEDPKDAIACVEAAASRGERSSEDGNE